MAGRPRGIPNPNGGRKVGSDKKIPADVKARVIALKAEGKANHKIVIATGLTEYIIRKILRSNIQNANQVPANTPQDNSQET